MKRKRKGRVKSGCTDGNAAEREQKKKREARTIMHIKAAASHWLLQSVDDCKGQGQGSERPTREATLAVWV